MQDYAISLKRQAILYEYGNNLDETICDQLVVGIYDERVRKRLLADPNLSLEKAIELMSIEEQVERDT